MAAREWLAAVLLIAITCLFAFFPHLHPESWVGMGYHWWLDMLIHGGYYFAISLLLFPFYGRRYRRWWFFAGVLLLSYGLEAGQLWVPGRSFSALDFLSNSLGVLAAAGWSRVGWREE